MLLIDMYNNIYNQQHTQIPLAPHWRTIDQYGGHMTITEFRDSFDNSEYKSHGIIRGIKQDSIVSLFEKKLKF